MTNLTPVHGDTTQETRLALYYEQRERILERTRAEAATHRESGTVFASIIVKALLSFNGAAILGYPVFVHYIPDALHTESAYHALELLLEYIIYSFALAMVAAVFMHLKWVFVGMKTREDEKVRLAQLDHLAVNTLGLNLPQLDSNDLEKIKRTGKRCETLAGCMDVSWATAIFASAYLTIGVMLAASTTLRDFPTP